MNMMVVGCGRVGAELAYKLFQKGHDVTVIDELAIAFDSLPADFLGRTVEGEVLSRDTLRRAGVESANGLAAVTNSDATNAVVAHLAHVVYNVPNIIVRNYDPHWRPLHEAFGYQVVSSTSWGAQRIEELLSDTSMRSVFSAGNGEVEIYEYIVPSAWAGRAMQDLFPDGECRAVAFTRAGRAVLPVCDQPLAAGDVVHFSATYDGIEHLRARLATGPQEE